MHLCFPLKIVRAWFANVAHQDYFIFFFSVTPSLWMKQFLCFLPSAAYPSFRLLFSRDINCFLFSVLMGSVCGFDKYRCNHPLSHSCYSLLLTFRPLPSHVQFEGAVCSLRPSFFVFHYICNFSVGWQLQISWTVSVVFLWHWFNKANMDENPLAHHLSFPSPTKHIFFWYLWPMFWSMGFWFQWGSVKSFKFLKLQILFITFPLCANYVCVLKSRRVTCVFNVILFFRF